MVVLPGHRRAGGGAKVDAQGVLEQRARPTASQASSSRNGEAAIHQVGVGNGATGDVGPVMVPEAILLPVTAPVAMVVTPALSTVMSPESAALTQFAIIYKDIAAAQDANR